MQISINPIHFPLFVPSFSYSFIILSFCLCLLHLFVLQILWRDRNSPEAFMYKIRLLVRSVELITRIATTLLSPLQRMLLRKYKVTIPVNLPAFYSTFLYTIFSVFPHTLHSKGVVCVTTRHVSEFISYVNTMRQCLTLWLPVRFMHVYVFYVMYVPGSGLTIYYPTSNKRKRKCGSSFGFRYSYVDTDSAEEAKFKVSKCICTCRDPDKGATRAGIVVLVQKQDVTFPQHLIDWFSKC